jgi:hypothetical protein
LRKPLKGLDQTGRDIGLSGSDHLARVGHRDLSVTADTYTPAMKGETTLEYAELLRQAADGRLVPRNPHWRASHQFQRSVLGVLPSHRA